MTYYKWITAFDELKSGPRNEELLNNLYKKSIDLEGNILYRFIIHINDLVRTRLKNSLDSILYKMKSIYQDNNALSLEIINIKKELTFAKKIANLPVIPEENKNKFKETLIRFANEINDALISSVNGIDTTGEVLLMIKNSKINVLED